MDLKDYSKKLVGTEEERAVSPVIGVILMVAITVILATVIAAFVMDMGSNQSSPAQAGLDITKDQANSSAYNVTVTQMSDNTDTIWCVGSSSDTGPVSSVGETISNCGAGSNIVANNTQGENTTIQSDIGN